MLDTKSLHGLSRTCNLQNSSHTTLHDDLPWLLTTGENMFCFLSLWKNPMFYPKIPVLNYGWIISVSHRSETDMFQILTMVKAMHDFLKISPFCFVVIPSALIYDFMYSHPRHFNNACTHNKLKEKERRQKMIFQKFPTVLFLMFCSLWFQEVITVQIQSTRKEKHLTHIETELMLSVINYYSYWVFNIDVFAYICHLQNTQTQRQHTSLFIFVSFHFFYIFLFVVSQCLHLQTINYSFYSTIQRQRW